MFFDVAKRLLVPGDSTGANTVKLTTKDKLTAFTPEAVAKMNQAYDKACDVMKAAGVGYEFRARVRDHILLLGEGGETDAHKMCDLAIQNGWDQALHRAEV